MKKNQLPFMKLITGLCMVLLVSGVLNAATYQAEDYTSQSGCSVTTQHSGYTGVGYLDYGSTGTYGEWNNISMSGSGTVTLTLTFANGGSTSRICELTVNGVSQGNITFAQTSLWTTWTTVSVDIPVSSGNNTIRLTADGYGPNLDKLDLGDVTSTTSNLALNKSITVSAYQDDSFGYNPGENLVDGDVSDDARWSASGFPQWAEIDLGANYSLSQIRLYPYQDRAYQYIVEARVDGGSYSTIVNRSSNTESADVLTDNVSNTARYVRITVSGLSGSSSTWVSLSELEVYGESAGGSDTQAPSVPSGLSSSSITQTSFTLSWSASTDNVGVAGYEVFRNGSSIGTTTSTSMNVSGLDCETSYSMTVRASDAAGNWSALSSALNVSTSACSVSTNIALGKTATASSAESQNPVTNGNDGSTTTRWCASSGSFPQWFSVDLGSAYAITGTQADWEFTDETYYYRIETSPDNSTWTTRVDKTSGGAMDNQIDNFSASNVRYVRITITNVSSDMWASVREFRVMSGGSGGGTDTQAPSVPAGLSSSSITQTSFTLSWNSSTDNVGVTGYEVFRNGSSIGTTANTSMYVGGLSAGTTYGMRVRATDASGNWSAQSSTLNVTTSTGGGGDDWPTADNTGPSGTLTSYSGNFTASTNGQIIENMNISGKVYIKANNVTIRNCIIGQLDIASADSYTGCVVEDCILTWAGRHDFTLRRCEMFSQSADLIRIGGPNVTIEDCYLHIDGPRIGEDHSDILQEYPVGTGDNLVMRHNRCYIAMTQNSVVISSTDMLFENNLVAGGSYTMNTGSGNNQLINNHFSTLFYPECGSFGPIHPGSSPSCSGNVWHETGQPLNCSSSGEVYFAEALQQNVKIYPNPLSGDVLNIQLTGYETDEVNINITDLTGRLVYSQLHSINSDLRLPVNTLSEGIYIVSVVGEGINNQQKLVVR